MAATATINMKIDPVVKEQAKRVFEGVGLDMSTAIGLFLRQAIRVNGIPFAIANSRTQPTIDERLVITPEVTDKGVLLPADWDDPEDAVYDDLA